jgi:hypothetical protein
LIRIDGYNDLVDFLMGRRGTGAQDRRAGGSWAFGVIGENPRGPLCGVTACASANPGFAAQFGAGLAVSADEPMFPGL